MYIIDDFTNKDLFLEEDNEEISAEQNKSQHEILDLCLKISELEHSQYTEVTDEALINKLKSDVYEIVKEAAFISHGKSEIEFDDTKGICYITLYSKFLFLNDAIGISSTATASLLSSAIWTRVTPSDDYIKVQFMFGTKKKFKTADYSSKIEELKEQLKNYNKK